MNNNNNYNNSNYKQKKKTCVFLDLAIRADRYVAQKEAMDKKACDRRQWNNNNPKHQESI